MILNIGKMMIIAERETFIIKVLADKLKDAHIEPVFVADNIDAINSGWDNSALLTYYLELGERISPDLVTYLKDKLSETNKQIIMVGDSFDLKIAMDSLPSHLIQQTFERPLDYSSYLAAVSDYFKRSESRDRQKNILVVDDDPNYMGLVREWLKDEHKIYMANSGTRAIKWLVNNKADLILLDYEMPVTSGPQVLEMLRNDEDTKDIPVIFLTGKDDRESVMSVLSLKPEGYILKTSGKEEIVNTVRKFFMDR